MCKGSFNGWIGGRSDGESGIVCGVRLTIRMNFAVRIGKKLIG